MTARVVVPQADRKRGWRLSSVWYAAYGSNMCARRLNYYINGGTPPGTRHDYPGFRDRTPPARAIPLELPGTIYFSWESRVWGGGIAFHTDRPRPGWPTTAAARGYLLTREQFGDLLTQEMYGIPGRMAEVDIDEIRANGRLTLGSGRYETLVYAGEFDGAPIMTFTSPWDPETVDLRKPTAQYLGMLAEGLHESRPGWDPDRIVGYLAGLPGVRGLWAPTDLRALTMAAVGECAE